MKVFTPSIEHKNRFLSGWLTQPWIKLPRHKSNLKKETWLNGPIGKSRKIDAVFFEELTKNNGLYIDSTSTNTGLLEKFFQLNSAVFEASWVHPKIVDFYENTGGYEFDVWSEWAAAARPFARLLSVFFGKRLQQLNLPLSSMDLAYGMTSEIVSIRSSLDQSRQYAGWLRKINRTGDVLFAGAYMSCCPPNLGYECVKAIFPLPNGNITVIFRPENVADGSFKLHSVGNRWGDSGLYFLVNCGNEAAYVKFVKSIAQTIHVYLDDAGELRTDHIFKFWGIKFLHLHYRIRNKRAGMG
ncbi:MAG: hypothetical protein AAGD96_08555 [Chloroflexota bacterium]